jgi:hypothetical protein
VTIKRQSEKPKFSFDTQELRQAARAKQTTPAPAAAELPARDAGGGFDPYNSSGSFDRKKNWARVGKR